MLACLFISKFLDFISLFLLVAVSSFSAGQKKNKKAVIFRRISFFSFFHLRFSVSPVFLSPVSHPPRSVLHTRTQITTTDRSDTQPVFGRWKWRWISECECEEQVQAPQGLNNPPHSNTLSSSGFPHLCLVAPWFALSINQSNQIKRSIGGGGRVDCGGGSGGGSWGWKWGWKLGYATPRRSVWCLLEDNGMSGCFFK